MLKTLCWFIERSETMKTLLFIRVFFVVSIILLRVILVVEMFNKVIDLILLFVIVEFL